MDFAITSSQSLRSSAKIRLYRALHALGAKPYKSPCLTKNSSHWTSWFHYVTEQWLYISTFFFQRQFSVHILCFVEFLLETLTIMLVWIILKLRKIFLKGKIMSKFLKYSFCAFCDETKWTRNPRLRKLFKATPNCKENKLRITVLARMVVVQLVFYITTAYEVSVVHTATEICCCRDLCNNTEAAAFLVQRHGWWAIFSCNTTSLCWRLYVCV